MRVSTHLRFSEMGLDHREGNESSPEAIAIFSASRIWLKTSSPFTYSLYTWISSKEQLSLVKPK